MSMLILLLVASTLTFADEIAVNLEMNEENIVGMKIGSLREYIPSDIGSNLNFLLTDDFLHVDLQTGDVTVVRTIDRESLCPQYKLCCGVVICFLKSNVFVIDNAREFSMSINLKVNILDINDNKPVFSSPTQRISVSEGSPVGKSIVLLLATDADINPKNQIIRYKLEEPSGTFKLDRTTYSIASLKLMQPLDRERVANYSAKLVACDEKSCATSILNIEIEDENDNSPQFERRQLSQTLSEDTPVRTLIFQLNATDADSGERARVVYNFREPVDGDLKNTFELDTKTGQISLRRRLDASIRDKYKFEVVACDSVAPGCTGDENSTAEVVLIIQDVNNNRPIIEIVHAGNKNASISDNIRDSLSIYENTQPGSVAIVKVDDHDVGVNARTFCELETPAPGTAPTFILSHGTSTIYHLRTARMFDFEQEAVVTTTVKCEDSGSPPLSSARVITLRILDINEFPPEFSQRIFHTRVRENSASGVEVIGLTAMDKDGQAELRYTLAPPPLQYISSSHLAGSPTVDSYEDRENIGVNRHFTLDPKTGVLRTSREQLDREKLDRITLIVLVTDALRAPIFTATATVSIEVLDENDNSPVFVNPPTNVGPMSIQPEHSANENAFTVRENAPRYTRLSGRLEARDPDAGLNGQVHFSLRSTWALKGGLHTRGSGYASNEYSFKHDRELVEQRIFQITPDGGIETLVELDRETVSSYLLEVAVRDNGTQPMASTAMLLVQVLDENDNRPVWKFPSEAARQFNITTANHLGTLITTLQANDIDADAAGTVEFQVLDSHGKPIPPISLARGLFQHPNLSDPPSTTPIPIFVDHPVVELKGYRTGPFYLNGSTGELLVADRLLPGSSKIRIRAIDLGPQHLSADTWVTVNIKLDPNEYGGGFLGSGRAGALNVIIILVMIAVTAIISLLLIIAIVCVRRKPARYNGVIQTGQDYTGSVPGVCSSPYMDPNKEALASNPWMATVGSKDCSGNFYPGSLLVDENGQIVSSGPLNYGSPVMGSSGMGTSDNTSIMCLPQHQQQPVYAADMNGDINGGLAMHTFGTISRNHQRPAMGSLHGSVSGARMGGSLQYEPPLDVDSGDSGRGPSEDGNQLMMLENQRNGLFFSPHSGAYPYGTYSAYRPSSRAGYGRSASAMSGNINCTTPRSFLHNCSVPQTVGGMAGTNCACNALPEDQCSAAYNDAVLYQQKQQQFEAEANLYSSRMLLPSQSPTTLPGMVHRSQLSPSPRRGFYETGSLQRNRLAHSSVTFQSPSVGGYLDDGSAPIKLDLRGVNGGGGIRSSGEEEFMTLDPKQSSFVDGRPPSVPRPPDSTTRSSKMTNIDIDG